MVTPSLFNVRLHCLAGLRRAGALLRTGPPDLATGIETGLLIAARMLWICAVGASAIARPGPVLRRVDHRWVSSRQTAARAAIASYRETARSRDGREQNDDRCDTRYVGCCSIQPIDREHRDQQRAGPRTPALVRGPRTSPSPGRSRAAPRGTRTAVPSHHSHDSDRKSFRNR